MITKSPSTKFSMKIMKSLQLWHSTQWRICIYKEWLLEGFALTQPDENTTPNADGFEDSLRLERHISEWNRSVTIFSEEIREDSVAQDLGTSPVPAKLWKYFGASFGVFFLNWLLSSWHRKRVPKGIQVKSTRQKSHQNSVRAISTISTQNADLKTIQRR